MCNFTGVLRDRMHQTDGPHFGACHSPGAIVMETMDNPPLRPHSINSYLPPLLIERAQSALKLYGLDIKPMPPARQSLSVLQKYPTRS